MPRSARPWVRLHVGQSADGKLAAPGQGARSMGGPADRRAIAGCRAWADAVLVGASTVRHANVPMQLHDGAATARRLARGQTAGPRCVVLSGSGAVPAGARAFRQAATASAASQGARPAAAEPKPLLAVGAAAQVDPALELVATVWRSHCLCVGAPHAAPYAVCIPALLAALHKTGVRRLLVEGGGQTAWSFVACNALDELVCTVAPLLLGGAAAPTPVAGQGLAWPDRLTLRLVRLRVHRSCLFLRYRVRACKP